MHAEHSISESAADIKGSCECDVEQITIIRMCRAQDLSQYELPPGISWAVEMLLMKAQRDAVYVSVTNFESKMHSLPKKESLYFELDQMVNEV